MPTDISQVAGLAVRNGWHSMAGLWRRLLVGGRLAHIVVHDQLCALLKQNRSSKINRRVLLSLTSWTEFNHFFAQT